MLIGPFLFRTLGSRLVLHCPFIYKINYMCKCLYIIPLVCHCTKSSTQHAYDGTKLQKIIQYLKNH